jgi:hypothetical protein
MEEAFTAWKKGGAEWMLRQSAAQVFAVDYDWETVWPKYFRPILAEMERLKSEREKDATPKP